MAKSHATLQGQRSSVRDAPKSDPDKIKKGSRRRYFLDLDFDPEQEGEAAAIVSIKAFKRVLDKAAAAPRK